MLCCATTLEEAAELLVSKPVPSMVPRYFAASVVVKNGLVLDAKSTGLSVASVGGGAAADDDCGGKATPDARVQPHDFVVAVNGKTSVDAMVAEIRGSQGVAHLMLLRPVPFEVTIRKGSSLLGAGLAYSKGSISLEIKQVRGGALEEYNAGVLPHRQVLPGDLLASVNGVAGDSTQMVEALKTASLLKLVVVPAIR